MTGTDFAQMALTVTTFLTPYLPSLLKLGEKAGEEIVKKTVDAGWNQAKALWDTLSPKIEAKPGALEAAQDAAAAPEDADAQAALRQQIKKLLAEDAALTREVSGLVEQGERAGVMVTVTGERAVGIAGNVIGSPITTGDQGQRTS